MKRMKCIAIFRLQHISQLLLCSTLLLASTSFFLLHATAQTGAQTLPQEQPATGEPSSQGELTPADNGIPQLLDELLHQPAPDLPTSGGSFAAKGIAIGSAGWLLAGAAALVRRRNRD